MKPQETAAQRAAGSRERLLDTIRVLSELDGISGQEGAVRAEILRRIGGRHPYEVDASGNLLVYQKGRRTPQEGKRVMLAAHMDEVGFLVTYVTEEGFLKFTTVGGIDSRVYLGKPVRIQTAAGPVMGVIGGKAVHQSSKEEQEQPQTADKLFIDISAKDRADALRLVSPGDAVCFASGFLPFGDGCIKGKALDDRVGCALLLELLEEEYTPAYDRILAFTVQEETGGAGACTAAFHAKPDRAIVVDVTTAADLPGVAAESQVCRWGEGPVLSFMDRATIYDSALYRLALDAAREAGIPAQPKNGVFGGNDAGAIHRSREGVPSVAVSLPGRYIHSPSCALKIQDIVDTLSLLSLLPDRLAEE